MGFFLPFFCLSENVMHSDPKAKALQNSLPLKNSYYFLTVTLNCILLQQSSNSFTLITITSFPVREEESTEINPQMFGVQLKSGQKKKYSSKVQLDERFISLTRTKFFPNLPNMHRLLNIGNGASPIGMYSTGLFAVVNTIDQIVV